MLDREIEYTASQANRFITLCSRQYTKNRGINRPALDQNVFYLRKMKAFLEELFQKNANPPPPPLRQSKNRSTYRK